MATGEAIENALIDELNDMGLPNMAATLDDIYHSDQFLQIDRLTLLALLIEAEYSDKISKRVNNRLRHAKLIGGPEELSNCVDSTSREYLPNGITENLASMNFVRKGRNICILGKSDSGKTYLAKAVGMEACKNFKVEYHHCDDFLEKLAVLKRDDFNKSQKRFQLLSKLDVLILDDFLLHTLVNEEEVKVLFHVLETRSENQKSTIVCSQRDPVSWTSLMLNDEISANAILKRVTKHYTIVINSKSAG